MDHILKLDDILYDSSSDDELEIISAFAIFRNSLQGEENILHDYFAASPVYPPNKFRRRIRKRRELFIRIHDAIVDHEPYFVQKRNVARKLGHSSLQKMTAAIKMLAYGVTTDFMDEYLRIGEATIMDSFKLFVKAAISIFSV
jgi:hypothetical protein